MASVDEMSVDVTLNTQVMFKLNEYGKALTRDLVENERLALKLPTQAQRVIAYTDVNSMALWDFMNFYGPVMHNGAEHPFESIEMVVPID